MSIFESVIGTYIHFFILSEIFSVYLNMSKFEDNGNTLKTHGSPLRHREITVELRKTKEGQKEKWLFKSRKINDNQKNEGPNGGNPVQMTVDEMVAAMNASDDPERQFLGMQQARRVLSRDRHPPIDMMISHGIVPLCVGFLQHYDNVMLQFEAAWALTNIVSGTSQQTQCVIEQNAVPQFVALLGSKATRLAEQAVWALGNIAGDGSHARDIVIHNNCIPGILRLVNKQDTSLPLLRNIVWLMSNLCRNKNPSPPPAVKHLLPVLSNLLFHEDHKLLTDACWALAYVTDDDNNMIQEVLDTNALPRLVKLLDSDESSIIVPALRTVGNIVTGTDEQTDIVIDAGGLPKLVTLLQHHKSIIVKEAAWTVSNITAGNQEQIQAVVDAGIFEQIRLVMQKGDYKAQKEAAWALFNTITSCTPEQVFDLLERYKLLEPFLDLLAAPDPRIIKVVETGLRNLFVLAEKSGRIKNFSLMVDDLGGLDKLMLLQRHENEEVFNKARSIIETYYTAVPDEVQDAQAPQQEYNNYNNNNEGSKD